MPIYEYACLECGLEFEELVRGDERPACPSCGKDRLERRMSVSAAGSRSGDARSARQARDAYGQGPCCGPSCNLGH